MMTTMRNALSLLVFFIFGTLLNPSNGSAVDFTVNPVTISFDAGQKTTILTVKNQSDESLTLQLSAFRWAQDEDGKDGYIPTNDIVLFPKILTIEKESERLIRMGIQVPPGSVEKTYRIYLEEIPQPQQALSGSAVLRTVMKIGVPVFVSPVKKDAMGEIDKLELTKGNLMISVHNSGNYHFIIKSVTVKGIDDSGRAIYSNEFGGWYLLEGRARVFRTKVPEDICRKVRQFHVDVSADILSLKEKLNVLQGQCTE
jgi:fimbrial chaperone protein